MRKDVTLFAVAQARGLFFEKLKRFLWRTSIFLFLLSLILLVVDDSLASEIGKQGEDLAEQDSVAGFRESPHLEEMPGLKRLTIPPGPGEAIAGSSFMEEIKDLPFEEREEEIYEQISCGNLPDFLRRMVTLESTFEDAKGLSHTVKYQVMPDYLAVGTDDDFCRLPMGPKTAQRIADLFGADLPTRKLADDIYRRAELKLEPVTYYPVGDANERVEQFVRHNTDIEERRKEQDGVLGQLTAGAKKDVVISNKIADPDRTHHVVIYGWHKLDGHPIQPLTNVHIDTYVDYSHGVRLINSEMIVDGVPVEMTEVLRDSVLYKLISDEDGVMGRVGY